MVAINAEEEARDINVAVDGRAMTFSSLLGSCAVNANAPGSYSVSVPALDAVVCKAEFEVE